MTNKGKETKQRKSREHGSPSRAQVCIMLAKKYKAAPNGTFFCLKSGIGSRILEKLAVRVSKLQIIHTFRLAWV